MLIVGAKGLAKEVLFILSQKHELDNLYFFDDITPNVPERLYGQFPIKRNIGEVIELFKKDRRFIIGVGNPLLRNKLHRQFEDVDGEFVSAISPHAYIGTYGTVIETGAIIMAGSVITNDVKIGIGSLINPNCTISHDSVLGRFVEISPGVQITGNCSIGDFCSIGANATILPKIKLGMNVTVGAGAVVTKDVSDGLTVVGVPARSL